MPRLQTLLASIARAVLDSGGPPPRRGAPLGENLHQVAERTHQLLLAAGSKTDLATALREAVAASLETFELSLRDAVAAVASERTEVERRDLTSYLELVPGVLRQYLRRPDDPLGNSVPENFQVSSPDDWLPLLPDRREQYVSGDRPKELDNWQVTDFRGFGIGSETWRGWDDTTSGTPTAFLKFITDPSLRKSFDRYADYFQGILDFQSITGLVRLRSVHMRYEAPCLEYDYVSGYDLAGLIRDWAWRYDKTKPEQASFIIRRIAKIVGSLHQCDPPLIHRGLKPSNVLFHPTNDGKVTMWVSDFGWGAISSAYGIKYLGETGARRLALRGASPSLYASPQQLVGGQPDIRDDVYALGMMWYQLLKRDLAAPAPQGTEWTLEFRKVGLNDGQAEILTSCLAEDPNDRPRDAQTLAHLIAENVGAVPADGSKNFQLKGTTTSQQPLTDASAKAGGSAVKAAKTSPFPAGVARSFRNSLGMDFVLIPAGTFLMGSPESERGRHDAEGPQHEVTISKPFYLGMFPVTQSQYQAVTGKSPSHFNRAHGGSPENPVEQVSWDDAVTFCERMNAIQAEADACRLYRLPTEAEWEYACRAGTTTAYCYGDSVGLEQVHFFGLSASTWAKEASSVGKTQKVGQHRSNPWGLFDIHGNVLEWCADWWSAEYYAESPPIDPTGPESGWQRVVRGGSFSQFVAECRSAARLGRAPGSRLNTVGFRVAVTIPGI